MLGPVPQSNFKNAVYPLAASCSVELSAKLLQAQRIIVKHYGSADTRRKLQGVQLHAACYASGPKRCIYIPLSSYFSNTIKLKCYYNAVSAQLQV